VQNTSGRFTKILPPGETNGGVTNVFVNCAKEFRGLGFRVSGFRI